jgi:AraC-like DNA-binding protein
MKIAPEREKIDYVARKYPYTTLMTWEFYKHKHSFWEMIICIKGSSQHFINELRYDFGASDIIIMKPDSVHDYKISDKDNYAHYDFYSTADDMKKVCDSYASDLYEKLAGNKDALAFSLDPSALRHLEAKLNQLNSLQSNPQFDKLAANVYTTVLHIICGLISENSVSVSIAVPDWLSGLLSLMSRHDMLCGKLSAVVARSGFSHGHLCRLFKKHTGETLIDYFTKLKIDYANVLLRNNELNILDIAGMLGYDSLSYFITLFKRYNNATPKQYRKTLFEA